jgi:putative transposase
MTGYDADGQLFEWGKNDMSRIFRLCFAVDKLQSRWSQADIRHRKRYRLKRVAHRLRLRIRNLVDDLHKRLAKWLCTSYRSILLPEFRTSQMVKRGRRKIRSQTARAMCTWAHYRFRERLLNKSRLYDWCQVIVVNEAYTTKTCGGCGWIHRSIGGSKTFKCNQCHIVLDRDANGARNILLRYLTEKCTL